LRLLAKEDYRWRVVEIRARRYLNNVVEQDHRAIKQRCASMLGLKSFRSAAITLAGVELTHRIRKGQHLLPLDHGGRASALKNLWDRALSQVGTPATGVRGCSPSMHQISTADSRSELSAPTTRLAEVRYLRKISFGRNLYLLVMPKGGRHWRYCYRNEIFMEIYLGGAREYRPCGCDWDRNFRLHLLAPLRSRGKDSRNRFARQVNCFLL
jgi:hypothetical protein